MRKTFFFLLLLGLLNVVAASEKHSDGKVEIYASKIDSHQDSVEANNGVTVVYKDYFIIADRATYNRKTGDLELFDNIRVNYKGNSKILGKYAKLNIKKKERFFEPFYMLDKRSQMWMSASNGSMVENDLDITSGTVSGCDQMDPLWTMDFSSSDYNAKTKWLNLYNMRLYIYDIPVLYTPYFGYSLDTTRRTGLLMPSLGLSDDEGLFYQQPIYIAEQNWWDLELTPQIRTRRGSGLYSTFRFVDSKYSHGEFTMGYFKEKQSYFQEKKSGKGNDSFYGGNFLYDNSNVINSWTGLHLKGQSGLYIDINSMNDVEYINLANNNTIDKAIPSQVLSRINFFYNTDNNYAAAYFKYYKDLDKPDNKTLIQQLPTLHYHHYLSTLLQDHLLYSLDMHSVNLTREEGKQVVQTDLSAPVTLQGNFFDEYLNVSYKALLYGQHSSFRAEPLAKDVNVSYNNGYYARLTHVFSANTQLTKMYENYIHVIGFGVSYTQDGGHTQSGYYEDKEVFCEQPENRDLGECEFYQIADTKNTTQFNFIQYVYDKSAKQILFHRLAQSVNYEQTNRYGELENELDYAITSHLSWYNNMFYNYDEKLFSKIFNQMTINGYGVHLSLSHLYKDNFLPTYTERFERYTSYMTSTLGYDYSKHWYFAARYDYDIEQKYVKTMEYGFLYKKRCWDFGLKYLENNRPISGQDPIRDRYILVNIALKPFMESNPNNSLFDFKLPEEKR